MFLQTTWIFCSIIFNVNALNYALSDKDYLSMPWISYVDSNISYVE